MPKTSSYDFFFETGVRPILPKMCEEKEYSYVQRRETSLYNILLASSRYVRTACM
jgi:hypothetical protein